MANGNNKKRKKKSSTIIPVMVTLLVLSLITGGLVFAGFVASDRKNSVNSGNKGVSGKDDDDTKGVVEQLSVEIHLENCTALVGTVIYATATVSPSGGNVVSWVSSDPSVLAVDSSGKVVVAGTGIATLTATIGTVNDTVIIEGVQAIADSVLKFPEYNADSIFASANQQVMGEASAAEQDKADNTQSIQNSSEAPTKNPQISVQKPTSVQDVTSVQGVTQSPTSAVVMEQPTAAQMVQPPNMQPAKPISNVASVELPLYLSEYGFVRHLDGTYVFEKDDTIYGEIVLDSDKTHIYIFKHSDDFDLAALSAIAQLLPESYETVWNTADKAATDITMNADGRVVRVVVAQGGGHKQLVIFN